jgi:hypothetical protein
LLELRSHEAQELGPEALRAAQQVIGSEDSKAVPLPSNYGELAGGDALQREVFAQVISGRMRTSR